MTLRSTFFLRFALVAVCGALLTATLASATLWVRVSDENLVRQAVDRGLIVEVRAGDWSPAYAASMPSTDQRMEVLRVIHGDLPNGAEDLTVRWRGGESASGYALKVFGVEPLARNATAILFLKPGADGTWDVFHLFQGVFQTVRHEGRDYAFRTLGGTELDLNGKIVTPAGDKLATDGERARALEPFVEWIRSLADGVTEGGPVPAADYWRDVSAKSLQDAAAEQYPEKFTLLSNLIRWRQFDSNQNVGWRAHQAGQPLLTGGGFAQFRSAQGVWNNDPGSTVRYTYLGTTTSTQGFKEFDGINAIVFDDLDGAGEFDEAFNCSEGGVVAVGGPWFGTTTHQHQGTTYRNAFGADIITNEGAGCLLRTSSTAEEVFGHELGHTLGLAHSCGDDASGSCAGRLLQAQAMMRATVHGDGRGARLNDDDRAGIAVLYPSGATLPPDAPSGLSASNGGLGVVNLNWTDNAGNETGFAVERRTQGGTFSQIGSTGANVRSFSDTSAPTGSSLTYRVRAFNGAGNSAFSNNASVNSNGPSPPTSLAVTALSAHSLRLDWNEDTDDETGFEIQIRRQPGSNFTFATFFEAGPGATQAVFDELFSDSGYEFRVRALTDSGNSSWSNTASGSTLAYPVGEACVPGSATLCLNDGRFQNRLLWRQFDGLAGLGRRIPTDQSTDSGLFWFFGAENWEMLVKNLDGCGFNDAFWVFLAATTNVEYTLQVIDTWTGEAVTYFNPLGIAAPTVTDIGAFGEASCNATAPAGQPSTAETADARAALGDEIEDFFHKTGLEKNDGCDSLVTGTDTTLFLNGGRFEIEADWRDFNDNAGPGRVVQFCSEDSGLVWFFGPDNWELLVKVLDACNFNDRYWVFAAATTNVEYTLRVTDTVFDVSNTYFNPLGQASNAVTDTSAFATCP